MTPHRKWFTSFKPYEEGSILMGDDGICKVEGIGSVQVRSHAIMVVTLTDVRYVPQLKKNLLSFDTFDRAGYEGK